MRRAVVAVLGPSAFAAGVFLILPVAGHAQGERSVVVTLSCPADSRGAVTVTVNPWIYSRAQGADASWILNTNGADNRIEIRAKEGWPYAQSRASGNGRVEATGMKPDAAGVYDYDIAVFCGEERVVIDPKMRVE